jgi:FlaA1/EpsC-like NDP-sugar epimerase
MVAMFQRLALRYTSNGIGRVSAWSRDGLAHMNHRIPSRLASLRWRRALAGAVQVALVALANYLGFWLRFDGAVPSREWQLFLQTLPCVVVVHAALFVAFGLHRGFWRYMGLWELARLLGAVTTGAGLLYLILCGIFTLESYPRSIFIISSLLLVFFVSGLRLTVRMSRELRPMRSGKRILIFGAGDAGEMILRDLRKHRFEPVGFVDDDPAKTGREIHGTRVLGARDELPRIMAATKPQELLVAIPSASPSTIRGIVQVLEAYKVPITTLPRLQELGNGTVAVHQMRKLAIEDLLTRAPVGLDSTLVRHLIEGRSVMVTGAGGSIGSELCRQVAALLPSTLVLYERYENSLYAIANDLGDRGYGSFVRQVVGDITDRARLHQVMSEHKPDVVFHAAAHKHVPLMELNPCEAIKNNVIGTKILAEVAAQRRVGRFVLISTDKAVHPTSMMGATKRVAEVIVQDMAQQTNACFTIVRFGNVLGSNGSVLLRWLDQIKTGGPVTVTHPEIQRYFMLIPEAVQLVLHATAVAKGGETFVLDMGQQVKLIEMARNVIRLSGFIPDKEIPITFTGLRPGEKLFEELVGGDESVERLASEKILRVRPRPAARRPALAGPIAELSRRAARGDLAGITRLLKELVPTFRPDFAFSAASVEAGPVDAPHALERSGSGLGRRAAPAARRVQSLVVEAIRHERAARLPELP